MLESAYGFPISLQLAQEMLRGWFGHQGYLYTGVHLRNLPWMVGYFGGAASLYGRKIGLNIDLANAVTGAVPGAFIESTGQLLRRGPWFDVQMQTLKHQSKVHDHELVETMDMRVQDFTRAQAAGDAPTLYRHTIQFDPDRFEALLQTPIGRARRNEVLLAVARDIEEAYR